MNRLGLRHKTGSVTLEKNHIMHRKLERKLSFMVLCKQNYKKNDENFYLKNKIFTFLSDSLSSYCPWILSVLGTAGHLEEEDYS